MQPIRAEGGTAAGCDGVAKPLGVQQLEEGGKFRSKQAGGALRANLVTLRQFVSA